jgi:acyl carrier protein
MDQGCVRNGGKNLKEMIFERVRGIASDLLDIPAEQITPNSSPDNLEAWSSIQHLNLVLAIEENFKVQLSPEDMEQMNTIERIVNIVEDKLQA